jgi:hypothetical protein
VSNLARMGDRVLRARRSEPLFVIASFATNSIIRSMLNSASHPTRMLSVRAQWHVGRLLCKPEQIFWKRCFRFISLGNGSLLSKHFRK